ncbi:hypothetical protein DID75_04465 [Candidatus Marinamargulisbacteria bacterium SCGC AG-410-N11]|nr:hypothetical protein DID75_04465 [Candidatus Marinamargulisbacteria bacterium SCGC AG-410-N11]
MIGALTVVPALIIIATILILYPLYICIKSGKNLLKGDPVTTNYGIIAHVILGFFLPQCFIIAILLFCISNKDLNKQKELYEEEYDEHVPYIKFVAYLTIGHAYLVLSLFILFAMICVPFSAKGFQILFS